MKNKLVIIKHRVELQPEMERLLPENRKIWLFQYKDAWHWGGFVVSEDMIKQTIRTIEKPHIIMGEGIFIDEPYDMFDERRPCTWITDCANYKNPCARCPAYNETEDLSFIDATDWWLEVLYTKQEKDND